MRKYFLSVALLLCVAAHAQFTENFSDGNLTANPQWVGNAGDFIVNAAGQLQSNGSTANSSFYISTASTLASSVQWEWYVQLGFNTSSANYTDVFVMASASDITASGTNGYFVRIGNTSDEISLYKKSGSTITKLIDGADGITNVSNNTLKIKLIRDAANQWILYRDISGTGNSYVSEGAITDNSFNSSAYFGILIKQSTASFFQKHFFDDIQVTPYSPDVTAPVLVSATAISNTQLDVLFDEPVEAVSAQVAANYNAGIAIGAAASAIVDASNPALVHVLFANAFPNGVVNTLTADGIKDLAGNAVQQASTTFSYYTPQPFDVLIDELMADPTPVVGLPANEWIELKNTTAFPIAITGWKIEDANGVSGALPAFILKPDSFVIICTSSAASSMALLGTTLAVSNFPSLDNNGETIALLDANGRVIHAVSYSIAWYQNELKKDGGWSLEMIDTHNPCSGGSNWLASTNLAGGTPGKKNAVDAMNADMQSPQLLRAFATDATHVVLVFDEPLAAGAASVAANYAITNGLTAMSATVSMPLASQVILQLNTAMQVGTIYTITANALTDCAGNSIGTKKTARVGVTSVAAPQDVVINEVLFNPPSNGVDYVELFNRSNKVIDLKQLYLANRNTAGDISNITALTAGQYQLFPQEYIVLTQNPAWVKSAYITQNPDALLAVAAMPGYNDDEGNVIVLNAQGEITDELKYSDKWHFKLIDNKEGVALERIDDAAPTQLQDNWHSAASSVNYGTPTYQNSQYHVTAGVQGQIKVTPEIVSPDNDGQDDFATVEYSFPEAGYVANITIFDAAGRPVRYLQRNALCGTKGNFRWDGLGDRGQQLATGVYVLFTEVFNLQGHKKRFKNSIVVARRN
jgi:hypothetical protein